MIGTGRERPWRAIAYVPDPTGQTDQGRKRKVAGRTSARTRAGLQPFIDRHTAQGHVTDVIDVEPIPFDQENQP